MELTPLVRSCPPHLEHVDEAGRVMQAQGEVGRVLLVAVDGDGLGVVVTEVLLPMDAERLFADTEVVGIVSKIPVGQFEGRAGPLGALASRDTSW